MHIRLTYIYIYMKLTYIYIYIYEIDFPKIKPIKTIYMREKVK